MVVYLISDCLFCNFLVSVPGDRYTLVPSSIDRWCILSYLLRGWDLGWKPWPTVLELPWTVVLSASFLSACDRFVDVVVQALRCSLVCVVSLGCCVVSIFMSLCFLSALPYVLAVEKALPFSSSPACFCKPRALSVLHKHFTAEVAFCLPVYTLKLKWEDRWR